MSSLQALVLRPSMIVTRRRTVAIGDYDTTENPCDRHSAAPSLSSNLSPWSLYGEPRAGSLEQKHSKRRAYLWCFEPRS